jgi:hypothetical protein
MINKNRNNPSKIVFLSGIVPFESLQASFLLKSIWLCKNICNFVPDIYIIAVEFYTDEN